MLARLRDDLRGGARPRRGVDEVGELPPDARGGLADAGLGVLAQRGELLAEALRPAEGDEVGAGLPAAAELVVGVALGELDGALVGLRRAREAEQEAAVDRAAHGIATRTGSAFQISSAYSRMVRSEENHPMPATLRTAMAAHRAGSRQASSTRRRASA